MQDLEFSYELCNSNSLPSEIQSNLRTLMFLSSFTRGSKFSWISTLILFHTRPRVLGDLVTSFFCMRAWGNISFLFRTTFEVIFLSSFAWGLEWFHSSFGRGLQIILVKYFYSPSHKALKLIFVYWYFCPPPHEVRNWSLTMTWMTTKIKWSRHRSFLYECDRLPGMRVLKLGIEIPNLKQHNWFTELIWKF